MTDKKIALIKDIGTDEIDPYELIDSGEESEFDNEESHSSGSDESDSDD